MAVIFIIIPFSNSDILDSKWQIITLLLSFVKYLIRAASENFRSACYVLIENFNKLMKVMIMHALSVLLK